MSGNILQLHKPKPCDDTVAMLRQLADDIEAGEIDFPVTTCVVLLGHTNAERPGEGQELLQEMFWRTYGFGPRTDTFTVRGLMATCLNRWNHDA
jgi:hypothetical protein